MWYPAHRACSQAPSQCCRAGFTVCTWIMCPVCAQTPWSRACSVLPGSAGVMDPPGQVLSRVQPCLLQSLYPQESLLEWSMSNPGALQGRLETNHLLNALFQWWPPDLCPASGLHSFWQRVGEKLVSFYGNGGQERAAVIDGALSHLQSCLQGHVRKRVPRNVCWSRLIFLVRDA